MLQARARLRLGFMPTALGSPCLSTGVSHMSQLAAEVQTIILATFNVSEEEATVQAERLAGLAVGWSGEEGAAQIAWVHLVKKDLGERFPWKSEADADCVCVSYCASLAARH